MDVQQVIDQLKAARGPSRHIDGLIAQLAGWEKVYEPTNDKDRPNILWLEPGTKAHTRFPDYTSSLDAAYNLAQQISPSNVGAVSWGDGLYSARMNDGPICKGATEAIALCIAALTSISSKDNLSG